MYERAAQQQKVTQLKVEKLRREKFEKEVKRICGTGKTRKGGVGGTFERAFECRRASVHERRDELC